MVLILEGNYELGAHVWSNICYLVCLFGPIMFELPFNASTMSLANLANRFGVRG